MLFLSRAVDEKINIGTDSWMRFCGILDGDAVVTLSDNGRTKIWSMMLNGKPYYFENGTELKYVGFNRGEAQFGFNAPQNVLVLREEVENYME